jgi:DNA modification methylase
MILHGDCRDVLKQLAADGLKVQCVITSPPYWGLRSYLPDEHADKHAEIGSEPTPEAWVETMVGVFRMVREVLRDDGVVFVNVGDAYAGSNQTQTFRPGQSRSDGIIDGRNIRNRNGTSCPNGIKPKDLIGLPWMLAFALRADGWYLRSEIIWAKGMSFCPSYSGSVMPESVSDRPTKAHEQVFLLSKSAKYFYDAEAVREQNSDDMIRRSMAGHTRGANGKMDASRMDANNLRGDNATEIKITGRNLRTVWTINPQPMKEAHFATFPERLVEPMILAGTSEKGCCAECGAPWVRNIEKNVKTTGDGKRHIAGYDLRMDKRSATIDHGWQGTPRAILSTTTLGWLPSCKCQDAATIPCTVLDPFGGSGTVSRVAQRLGRRGIMIELSEEYVAIAKRRAAQRGLEL